MSEENNKSELNENKVIDESSYAGSVPAPKPHLAPAAIGRGGDPFYRKLHATDEQLKELNHEIEVVQNWINRETSNTVALNFLEINNLKEIYFEMKDGFESGSEYYGKLSLKGFKTPQGVEIIRLQILDSNGDVLKVVSGPLVLEELKKRIVAYTNSINNSNVISDYDGNINDSEISLQDYDGSVDQSNGDIPDYKG